MSNEEHLPDNTEQVQSGATRRELRSGPDKSPDAKRMLFAALIMILTIVFAFIAYQSYSRWHDAQTSTKMSKVKDGEKVTIGFKSFDGISLARCQSPASWNKLVDEGKVKLEGPITVTNGTAKSTEKTACLRTLTVIRNNSGSITGLKSEGDNLVTKAGVKYPRKGLFSGVYSDAQNYFSK